MPANIEPRQRPHLFQEVFMDKPFGVLVIVLAIFVTIGALATSSLTPGSDEERGAVRAEHSVAKQPAQQKSPNRETSATNAEIDRGKYLVENVAMCVECHT